VAPNVTLTNATNKDGYKVTPNGEAYLSTKIKNGYKYSRWISQVSMSMKLNLLMTAAESLPLMI
jgi:hypothetical protein